MLSFIHTAFNTILNLIFPDRCAGCFKEGELFCQECELRTRKRPRVKSSVLFIDKIYNWGVYEDNILSKALRTYKYRGAFRLSDRLSDLLVQAISPEIYLYRKDCIVTAVPAAKSRKNSRGYNQAELLAQKFCQKMNLPYSFEILARSRDTISQTSLSGRERLFNQKDSFNLVGADLIKNKKVILIDDILTTGATLSEAARILKEAGAKEVIGLVVAK